MNNDTHALCPDCKRIKPLSDFNIEARRKNGHTSRCTPCHKKNRSVRRKLRRESWSPEKQEFEREKRLAYGRDYNLKHQEKLEKQRRRARVRANIREMIDELVLLRAAVDACAQLKKWNTWCRYVKDIKAEEYQIYLPITNELDLAAERRMLADEQLQYIAQIEDRMSWNRSGHWAKQRIELIVAELSLLSDSEIHEAFSYVPDERDLESHLADEVRRIRRHYQPAEVAKRELEAARANAEWEKRQDELEANAPESMKQLRDREQYHLSLHGPKMEIIGNEVFWRETINTRQQAVRVEELGRYERRQLLEQQGITLKPVYKEAYIQEVGWVGGGLGAAMALEETLRSEELADRAQKRRESRKEDREAKAAEQAEAERKAARKAYKAQWARDKRASKT